jgi:predicted DsbA family dithiol-disulfide isomerase
VQTKLAEALFAALFEGERDISRGDVLLEVAKSVEGLQGDEEAKEFLEGKEGQEEIRRADKESRESGVKGVPRFEMGEDNGGDREVLDGAVDVGEFFETLLKIKEANTAPGD